MAKDSRKKLELKLAQKLALQRQIQDLEEQVKNERQEVLNEKLAPLGLHSLSDSKIDQLVVTIKTWLTSVRQSPTIAEEKPDIADGSLEADPI